MMNTVSFIFCIFALIGIAVAGHGNHRGPHKGGDPKHVEQHKNECIQENNMDADDINNFLNETLEARWNGGEFIPFPDEYACFVKCMLLKCDMIKEDETLNLPKEKRERIGGKEFVSCVEEAEKLEAECMTASGVYGCYHRFILEKKIEYIKKQFVI